MPSVLTSPSGTGSVISVRFEELGKGIRMAGKHRLAGVMPNGQRWSDPASGVVFVAANGDIVHVDIGTLGYGHRRQRIDTGPVWTADDV